MPVGKVKVKMPHKGRTGVVDIVCQTKTVKVPVGPYRFASGSRKGQFVPIRDIRRNFATLVDAVQKAK
jgi:hypothetical protein